MKLLNYLFLSLCLILMISCQSKKVKRSVTDESHCKGLKIINKTIQKHGGDFYKTAHFQFDFRGKTYSFEHQEPSYTYTSSFVKDNNKINDILKNGEFTRLINQKPTTLTDTQKSIYSNGLNSVLYFSLLPYKLNDQAVIKEYEGETIIFDQTFDVVKVTFKEEGGGVDHDDVFYYWIHQEQKTVDFLAYKYHVNEGGIRFRRAYNSRNIDGILFQDYINYSAPNDSSLSDLPKLFQEDQLKEVSRIEISNIKNLAI